MGNRRAVVIGHGSWGAKVAEKLHDNPDVTLAGIVDPARMNSVLRAPVYSHISAFAEDNTANVAFICTPPYQGRLRQVSEVARLVTDCVHLAKPACVDIDEIHELEALEAAGMQITVGHTTLYAAEAVNVRKWLRDKLRSGRTHVVAERYTGAPPAHGGNAIVDLASHDVAFLMECFGPRAIVAGATRTTTSDRYSMLMRWESGRTATLTGGWGNETTTRKMSAGDGSSAMTYTTVGLTGSAVLTIGDKQWVAESHDDQRDPLEREIGAVLAGNAYSLDSAARVVRVIHSASTYADLCIEVFDK